MDHQKQHRDAHARRVDQCFVHVQLYLRTGLDAQWQRKKNDVEASRRIKGPVQVQVQVQVRMYAGGTNMYVHIERNVCEHGKSSPPVGQGTRVWWAPQLSPQYLAGISMPGRYLAGTFRPERQQVAMVPCQPAFGFRNCLPPQNGADQRNKVPRHYLLGDDQGMYPCLCMYGYIFVCKVFLGRQRTKVRIYWRPLLLSCTNTTYE